MHMALSFCFFYRFRFLFRMNDDLHSSSPTSNKGLFHSSRSRSNRNYRVKKRDNLCDDSDEDNNNDNNNAQHQTLTGAVEPLQKPTPASPHKEDYPLIQSQNAHALGEIYPGLSRLSFVDESVETSNLAIPPHLHPSSLSTMDIDEAATTTATTTTTTADSMDSSLPIAEFDVPPLVLQRAWGKSGSRPVTTSKSGDVVLEVRNTDGKGLGLFYASSADKPLSPGRLVFRELPLTAVVNDASLPFVCSSCFRDTRAESEQESTGNGPHDGPGAKPLRSNKLVRCAGCKVVYYCNKNCQLRDWKLHHQMECQGIQESMKNSLFQEIWTKKPSTAASKDAGSDTATTAKKPKLSARMDTTATRALCRLIRRQLRIQASERYKRENGGRADQREKQVREQYSTTFDQQELEWQDDHGFEWLERFIRTPVGDVDLLGSSTPAMPSTSDTTKNQGVENQKRLTRMLTLMASCIVPSKENRLEFFNSLPRQDIAASLLAPDQQQGVEELSSSSSSGAAQLARKLAGYGFTITNQETTKGIGLGLYIEQMAFMNHSCVPNCTYTFQGSRVECRIIRQVMPGEELTISYVDQIGTTRERQQQLKERYYFGCTCPLCLCFPANPLVSSDVSALETVAPNYVKAVKASQHSDRMWEAKQGFLCGVVGGQHQQHDFNQKKQRQEVTIYEESDTSPIVATEAHFDIYNKVNIACPECLANSSSVGTLASELDLEMKQENELRFEQQLARFHKEMKLLQQGRFSETMGDSRSFELWKAKNQDDIRDRKQAGIETRLGILPRAARRAYEDCLQILRNDVVEQQTEGTQAAGEVAIRRSFAHHLVRRFHQEAFDEMVASKRWVAALQESLLLEKILEVSYVDGIHPLRAIQALYTCKIANLLANLLLEESTIEVEDGDAIEFVDLQEEEDTQDVADMERELARQRREKQKKDEEKRQRQWFESTERRLANADKVQEVEMQAEEDERVITVPLDKAAAAEAMVTAPVVASSSLTATQSSSSSSSGPAASSSPSAPAPKVMTKRQARDKTFQEVLKMLQKVEPMVEDASLQQLFKIFWGVDGRIPRMYRDEVESFKQALYYAGLPMVVA
ncbi:Histone-lysine N-methyltransferase smyd1 [Actinomortierella wolfii]|nr:Histone-lysine N-methyltransferase smyd1 [Actinomortierella wolfii]